MRLHMASVANVPVIPSPPHPATDDQLREWAAHNPGTVANVITGLLDRIANHRATIAKLVATAPHNHTPTSSAAATAIRPVLSAQRHRILTALARQPDTCDGLEVRLSIPHTSCSARLNELVKLGWVRYHGTAPTRSGCHARVHHITEEGKRILSSHHTP